MPGKNGYITIRTGEEKQKIQKRLIMCTLKECYEGFKNQYQNDP